MSPFVQFKLQISNLVLKRLLRDLRFVFELIDFTSFTLLLYHGSFTNVFLEVQGKEMKIKRRDNR